MNQREDYHEAIKIKERLYEESGKGNTRLHPSEQVRQRPGQPFAWHNEELTELTPNWMEMVSCCSLTKLIFVVVEII